MKIHSWYFEKSEYVVTVTTGNTELPGDAFVVSGFDVSGQISSDGQALQNVEFVLFNLKNVSFNTINSDSILKICIQLLNYFENLLKKQI